MFRIRRIDDLTTPADKQAFARSEAILRRQFAYIPDADWQKLSANLRDPFRERFRSVLFVAETERRRVVGAAVVSHDPGLKFAFLDFLAACPSASRGGVGGALYERVREEAASWGCLAVLSDCLTDDPAACPTPAMARANAARLRFYEGYGARPVEGSRYDTLVAAEGPCPFVLVCDALDRPEPLRRAWLRRAVRAILERKYGDIYSPGYIKEVVASFGDDPVRLRPLRYVKPEVIRSAVAPPPGEMIALVVSDRHEIHHVRERGYVESPVRVASILEVIEPTGWFERVAVRPHAEKRLKEVHDPAFVNYLKRVCASIKAGRAVYPYVFPRRNRGRVPRDPLVSAGYYCVDTFTPHGHNSFVAARRAADCALTAADEILAGLRLAYALVRPPGHHAERDAYGGFCYFNNAALAAQRLSQHGTVAVLDLDFHHGNGQQDIFWRRADVLTVSIHAHPKLAYPHYAGFADERGEGPGENFNRNFPLPEKVDGERYRAALRRATAAIRDFGPAFVVVALGLDTAQRDPTGSWRLRAADFEQNGRMVGELGRPTLVTQEGGYRTRTLGENARSFFAGLLAGTRSAAARRGARKKPV